MADSAYYDGARGAPPTGTNDTTSHHHRQTEPKHVARRGAPSFEDTRDAAVDRHHPASIRRHPHADRRMRHHQALKSLAARAGRNQLMLIFQGDTVPEAKYSGIYAKASDAPLSKLPRRRARRPRPRRIKYGAPCSASSRTAWRVGRGVRALHRSWGSSTSRRTRSPTVARSRITWRRSSTPAARLPRGGDRRRRRTVDSAARRSCRPPRSCGRCCRSSRAWRASAWQRQARSTR